MQIFSNIRGLMKLKMYLTNTKRKVVYAENYSKFSKVWKAKIERHKNIMRVEKNNQPSIHKCLPLTKRIRLEKHTTICIEMISKWKQIEYESEKNRLTITICRVGVETLRDVSVWTVEILLIVKLDKSVAAHHNFILEYKKRFY